MTHEIRTATASDWPGIWPIVRAIVRAGETYTHPIDLDEDEGRTLWLPLPPWRTVVAVDGAGAVVGCAKFGPNQPGAGAHVANASFMVDPDCGGQGIGRSLGEYVLAAARDAGFLAMQFNAVVETNTGAVALWQSLGFETLATIPAAFRHPTRGLVGLLVMYRPL